ncbi:MAG TPA: hypothetical protein VII93_14380 [Anaerolineales bacterium]
MNSTPRWIPILFGGVLILMAAIILGAFFGIVPTEGGQFLAPPVVVISLGLCLLFGGLAMWVPEQAPAILRSGILIIALASLAAVCNWTAFAPGVVFSSSIAIGPFQFNGVDQVGGRIAFTLAAIAVDLIILFAISGWIRSRSRRKT